MSLEGMAGCLCCIFRPVPVPTMTLSHARGLNHVVFQGCLTCGLGEEEMGELFSHLGRVLGVSTLKIQVQQPCHAGGGHFNPL